MAGYSAVKPRKGYFYRVVFLAAVLGRYNMLFPMNFTRKWKRSFQANITLKMSTKIELA